MSNLTPVIDHIDWLNRRIYLKQWVIDYYPIEDIYHEYRTLRRSDTDSVRQYNPLIKAEGNISKGAGAFTPRYVVLLEGTKIVPFDEASQLNQLWDMITDDPDTDPTLYDISGLTTAKPIFIKPSEAETIQLNSESIVYSSFWGWVWVDINSIYSDNWSSTQPNWNQERPVNNIQLAVQIAEERWFDTLNIIWSITLDTWDIVDNYTLIGQNATRTVITINPWASTISTQIFESRVSWTLDWWTTLRECLVDTVDFVNWYFVHCVLNPWIITLADNSATLHMLDCYSWVAWQDTPTIDCGWDWPALAIRNYNWGLKLINKTGLASVSIDANSIHLKVDNTISWWIIVTRWIWYITDTGMTATLIDNLVNKESISKEVWNETVRELTSWWSWITETDFHNYQDSYPNKDLYKADVSNLSADVNIVQVKWVNVVDIDDFKATTTISSNMRWTDNANTIAPDNTTIWEIKTKVDTLNNYDDTLISAQLVLLERIWKSSQKIVWTQVIMYDEIWEIQRWNLSDVSENPSNENVFFRIKV